MNVKLSLILSAFLGRQAFGQDDTCIDDESALPNPISDYSKLYEDIWNADQDLNGVPGIFSSQTSRFDNDRGYVVVEEPANWDGDQDLMILSKVVIPESKLSTYKLVKKLFDNYTLDQSKPETPQTGEEKAEIKDFIKAIQDTEPMKLARGFIEAEKGTIVPMTDDEWYDMIQKIWFDIYDFTESTPHRSGFEHVFVGEQKGNGLGGYHFWWKYYLDDQALQGYANGEDNMRYNGTRYFGRDAEGVANPNAVTLSKYYYAVDFETDDLRTSKLEKRTGGFDVGCSPEGLIALGMVAFYDPRKRKRTVINSVKYEMALFKAGPEDAHINTFYSKFKGVDIISTPALTPRAVDEDTIEPTGITSTYSVRIIAALVNPDGSYANMETVTLINPSNVAISIQGWTIAGNNGNAFKLVEAGLKLDAGEVRTFRLPAADTQLTNKSAKITLADANGDIVNVVNYAKKDIKSGFTIVF